MAVEGGDGHLQSQTPVCVFSWGLSVTMASTIHPSINLSSTQNIPAVASETSCTCGPFPGTCGGSSMGGEPGAGTSGPACQDFLYPKALMP